MKTVFLLFTLRTFLYPTTSTTVSMRSIKSLSGKKNVQEYDWSSFVLLELIRKISTYEIASRSGRRKKNVGGCLFFLLGVREIYEDFLQYANTFASKVLKLQQSLNQLQISDSKAIVRVDEPSEEEVEEEECGDEDEADDDDDEDGDKGKDKAKDAHNNGDRDEDEDDGGYEAAARAGSKENEDEGFDSKEETIELLPIQESDERQDGKKRRRTDESIMI
ncbi:uncharacterized protein LOC129301096 isoform X1 [Prosopis cineraria]|uniref:uncharacterized protein LOC129301096 isoform X1 n=1 Tax=Prosopis cineraria TaxID=364024 RepID=UPI00240F40EF|nr:uncharacterized protein LOC129301096 isoform X1 [Prosopis cineraria]XP_054795636.1 uncharacterized protein LOC129301096 isoform X1 [Prosopis cineraria]XP_054795637.1 uncharacterized protein LOC129301096 isoform X1 [Prosopis cineraria]XP_054795638.1 uncharacterized protein LOC129301096 isoform X1 [Prosopis cineraria]XP_054795639.1 uncharacterized protein LOC129301096 isoform X1 [Prosopis cineraria]XP_054795640.1 uncharacterized protein LOC129301096 isoform X1 [Prosopis cineraria]XP_05479564